MKTAESVIIKYNRLDEMYFSYAFLLVSDELIEHWQKRMARLKLKILLGWGREIAKEQRQNSHDKYVNCIGMSPNAIKEKLLNAPLPETLKDK